MSVFASSCVLYTNISQFIQYIFTGYVLCARYIYLITFSETVKAVSRICILSLLNLLFRGKEDNHRNSILRETI